MTAPSALPHPIALYGALKSGTTLFRLILKHHPALHNSGESDFLLDHIHADPTHATGWRYDRAALAADRVFRAQDLTLPEGVDGRDLFEALLVQLAAKSSDTRMALVFHRNAEKMAALLPDAPVLHLIRDPRDVARSSIGMGWAGNSYYGVDHWIRTETQWDSADIDPARVLTVRFETLLGDLEAELTRVCAFLGLPYDPLMLTYHEHSTYEAPTAGIAQKWRTSATSREIAWIEGKCGPLLVARGYEADQTPVSPGAVERMGLSIENRMKRWRYNTRRYGAGLFLGHHAARVLGLKSVARRLAARQEAIRIANLK